LPPGGGPHRVARSRPHELVRVRGHQRGGRVAATVAPARLPAAYNLEDQMPQQLRPLAAEFVGTMLFLFLGAGSVVAFIANGPTAGSIGPVGVALAHGVGMAISVSMTLRLPWGHVGPAVM